MKVCGIEIKGSEALLAVATLEAGAPAHLALGTKKIALEDDDLADNVKAFARQARQFFSDNAITHLAIKKRSKKGEFAGGPTTTERRSGPMGRDTMSASSRSPKRTPASKPPDTTSTSASSLEISRVTSG
ncbi:hypothetical protein D3C85_1047360 [compost metagenome]